ncbi:hypothetical protein B0O99DRAFT_671186 [Bisporella sp. PMI_857]|nr:hypothetical protein B0O99DRAFT_671186 [Bisporella sp. PMI_857]
MAPSKVVVIGAGWSGLAAAKTYLQINPDVSLTILDEDSSVGGVWSASRVYPGLIADSCAAVFDYSDFPMHRNLGLKKWADLSGDKVHEYLELYVDKFDLRKRCRLNTRVVKVEREEDNLYGVWKIEVEVKKDFEEYTVNEILTCDKLIVATGVTSTPNFPKGLVYKNFAGPVMHSRDVGVKHKALLADEIKRVTVVGGSKSAIDVVYLCALEGKEVDWVIREDGNGPILLLDPRVHGIHAAAIKALRVTTIVGPNILIQNGFWYRFFHSRKSVIGPKMLKWALDYGSKSAIKGFYGRNENTMNIAPDMQELFWCNSGVSVVHDMKFMDLVADGKHIHIHRASLISLQPTTVTLSNDTVLPCDAVVFATGWATNQPSIFSSTLLPRLGLPFSVTDQDHASVTHWSALEASAAERIHDLFPILDPPEHVKEYDEQRKKEPSVTPFRLFRRIVPPEMASTGKRDLVVLGTLLNTAIPTYSEISSLWSVAYLEGLPFAKETSASLQNLEKMQEDVALMNSWGFAKTRCRDFPYLDGSQEIQEFMDLLVSDLGLEVMRKKRAARKGFQILGLRGWVKEWFTPYVGKDYRGLVDEYIEKWNLRGGTASANGIKEASKK